MQEVKPDTYNFIIPDSLNTMKIEVNKLRKTRANFKNSALITMSQATKAGDMRGSYDIVHDSDIVVKVTHGVAETIKNRFKEIGMKFQVFR
jgi:hypothetical protein